MESHYASPDRTDDDTLRHRIEQIAGNPVIDGVLESVGGLVAVLDDNRQIVAVNETFLSSLGIDDVNNVLGLRPGEAIGCVHANDMPGGCGTTRHCASCGAAIAIVMSLASGDTVERTCCVEIADGSGRKDLYLSVRAKRMTFGRTHFVLLFLLDITAEQSRAALERTFNHDLRNVLSALAGCAELLSAGIDYNQKEMAEMILHQTQRLQREFELQNLINAASGADFTPQRSSLSWAQILRDLRQSLARSDVIRNRTLWLDKRAPSAPIEADRSVLGRVLTNMARNALEATPEGGEVRIWSEARPSGELDIHVWNAGEIPPNVALRIFQRNFSTKSEVGRGLGTFSMKLLTERYLDGSVDFTTSEQEGTTFSVHLPASGRRNEMLA